MDLHVEQSLGDGSTRPRRPARRHRVPEETARRLVHVLTAPDVAGLGLGGLVRRDANSPASAPPGTGGRRRSVDRGFQTDATRKLREELGEPAIRTHGPGTLEIFERFRDGDGMVCVRLSSDDVRKGEQPWTQVHQVLKMCEAQQLRPRFITVLRNASGALEYEERMDFGLAEELIESGTVGWVAWRDIDRIARDVGSANSYFKLLGAGGVDLYVVRMGGRVDLGNAAQQLIASVLGAVGSFERHISKERMLGGLRSQWLEEGRGLPAQKRFGFRRNAQKFLEVDPEQSEIPLRVHEEFSTYDPTGNSSISSFLRYVHETKGWTFLKRGTLYAILTEEVYVSGEYTATFLGVEYAVQRVSLEHPVPRALFEYNKALLRATRSRSGGGGPGRYLLNGTPVYHHACQGEKRDGKDVLLKAKDGTYRHTSAMGGACRFMSIDAAELDAAVVDELWTLVESPELQAAYRANANPVGAEIERPTRAALDHLQAEVGRLERMREQVKRDWLDRVRATDDVNPRYLQEAVATLDDEIGAAKNQLELARRRHARRHEPGIFGGVPDEFIARAREILTAARPEDPILAQRRLVFVREAISSVVVHTDDDGGFRVELFGPLLPVGSGPVDPEALTVGSGELSASPRISEQLTSRRRGPCRPVWKSPIGRTRGLVLSASHRRDSATTLSVSTVLDAMRSASDVSPIGKVSVAVVARVAAESGNTISWNKIGRLQRREGLDWHTLWTLAIGTKEALRLGRIAAQTLDEWRMVIGWAVDAGVEFGPEYVEAWDRWASTCAAARVRNSMTQPERELGFSLAAEGRGIMVERGLVVRHRFAATWEACEAAIVRFDRGAPLGRLSGSAYEDWRSSRADLPMWSELTRALRGLGLGLNRGTRMALGPRGVVRGRIAPESRDDWLLVTALFIDHGFVFGVRWTLAWDAVRAGQLPWMRSRDTLHRAIRLRFGSMESLCRAARVRYPNGLPPDLAA